MTCNLCANPTCVDDCSPLLLDEQELPARLNSNMWDLLEVAGIGIWGEKIIVLDSRKTAEEVAVDFTNVLVRKISEILEHAPNRQTRQEIREVEQHAIANCVKIIQNYFGVKP